METLFLFLLLALILFGGILSTDDSAPTYLRAAALAAALICMAMIIGEHITTKEKLLKVKYEQGVPLTKEEYSKVVTRKYYDHNKPIELK